MCTASCKAAPQGTTGRPRPHPCLIRHTTVTDCDKPATRRQSGPGRPHQHSTHPKVRALAATRGRRGNTSRWHPSPQISTTTQQVPPFPARHPKEQRPGTAVAIYSHRAADRTQTNPYILVAAGRGTHVCRWLCPSKGNNSLQPRVSGLETRSVHDKLQTSAQTYSGLAAVEHCPCGWGHSTTQMPVPTSHTSLVTALCTDRAPPPPQSHSAETTEVPQHLQQPVGVNSPVRNVNMHVLHRCTVPRGSTAATGCRPAAGKLQTSSMPSNTRAQSNHRTTQSADNRAHAPTASPTASQASGRPTQTPSTPKGHSSDAGRGQTKTLQDRQTDGQAQRLTGARHREPHTCREETGGRHPKDTPKVMAKCENNRTAC